MTRLLHLSLLCLALGACQTFAEASRESCIDGRDERPWSRMSAPANALTLQRLADENPGLVGGWRHRRELWFSLPTGEITLCRLGENTAARFSGSGVTYEFARGGELTDNGAVWITTR